MKDFGAISYPAIFPAIDLRGGRCVRLVRGARDAEIRYDDDPVAVARRWEAAGARCLHVIDLGAALGESDSRRALIGIAAAVDIPVQAGGGLRDEKTIADVLAAGVARVLLGTRALRDPEFLAREVSLHGAERVMVSVDCEGERVKVKGWEEESHLSIDAALDLAREAGADRFLVTATDRDGTLSGPRLDLFERVLRSGGARVVAAGGIGTLLHVQSVLDLARPRELRFLEGVVVGRALYEGTVRLEEALALAAEWREERE